MHVCIYVYLCMLMNIIYCLLVENAIQTCCMDLIISLILITPMGILEDGASMMGKCLIFLSTIICLHSLRVDSPVVVTSLLYEVITSRINTSDDFFSTSNTLFTKSLSVNIPANSLVLSLFIFCKL